jgi:hypothetical protein
MHKLIRSSIKDPKELEEELKILVPIIEKEVFAVYPNDCRANCFIWGLQLNIECYIYYGFRISDSNRVKHIVIIPLEEEVRSRCKTLWLDLWLSFDNIEFAALTIKQCTD